MRVVRCFAFLDLCGFTAYTEEQGDARAVEVLAQLRAVLRAEAEDKGVRVTKWLGDGVMLSGVEAARCSSASRRCASAWARGAPGAARRGVPRAGDHVRGRRLHRRAGEHRGAAVRRGGRGADPRDGDTATFAPPGLETRRLHEIRVPGLSAPVSVCELTPPAREEADPPPSGIVGP